MTTETLTETRPTETRERTPADVLLAAARYIEEHGWCQYTLRDPDGRVCMIGAIYSVTDGFDKMPNGIFYAAESRLRRSLEWMHAPEFNDQTGRTEAEVLAALRAAAATS